MLISSHILAELRRTLAAAYFLARVEPHFRDSLLQRLEDFATHVALRRAVVGVATQPKDDPVLATALNANADYLVTGDKALLDLGTFEGTRIVTAANFVAIIDAQYVGSGQPALELGRAP
jgi:uncharacterized protein